MYIKQPTHLSRPQLGSLTPRTVTPKDSINRTRKSIMTLASSKVIVDCDTNVYTEFLIMHTTFDLGEHALMSNSSLSALQSWHARFIPCKVLIYEKTC